MSDSVPSRISCMMANISVSVSLPLSIFFLMNLKEMHDCGAYNLAQDEESSIVWGMPGEAVKAGAVDKVLNLQDLPMATINRAKMMQMNFKHQNSR